MQLLAVDNFVVLESSHGKFVVNRNAAVVAEHIVKHGKPHTHAELDVILGIIGTLPAECVVVDAGANAGLISIPIARAIRQKQGKVHAFEVQRMLFYALCGAAALNDADNLYAYNKGLGAKKGMVPCAPLDFTKQQDFGAYSLVQSNEHIILSPQAASEDIEIVAVDDLDLPRFDFFKIDVEGMEIDVLSGARRTIAQHQPWCWVEYWKVNIADIKNAFGRMPYKFYIMDQLNMLCAPISRLEADNIVLAAPEA